MIRIFTESIEEYSEVIGMINNWQGFGSEADYIIIVNPPKDSIAVVAWSIDDIKQALDGEDEISTDEIAEELFFEVIKELNLDQSIYDTTITAGNEMIACEIDEINKLVKKKSIL